MEVIKFIISIQSLCDEEVSCVVSCAQCEPFDVVYFPKKGIVESDITHAMVSVIRRNQFQFNKIMNSALRGKIKIGETINAVFIEGFPFLDGEAYDQFIQMDRRGGELKIQANESSLMPDYKIYADGSYNESLACSGYGGFIEDAQGVREEYVGSFEGGNSNLMELLAVANGLRCLQNETCIQVNTDSRFVIRGLVQWVHYWRHNDWQTAFGRDVKFAQHWQEIDRLCDNKLIEFKWIKGHAGHVAHDICHNLAKKSARFK